jgi:uncharacterized membrane protein YkvA (DUF1232 family)
MDKQNTSSLIPFQGGLLRDLTLRVKLLLHLLTDRRVNPFFKLIPLGALIYLVSPVDIIMGIPGLSALDDAAILWLGYYAFIEMCPPELVREYARQLISNHEIVEEIRQQAESGDVVDGITSDI